MNIYGKNLNFHCNLLRYLSHYDILLEHKLISAFYLYFWANMRAD